MLLFTKKTKYTGLNLEGRQEDEDTGTPDGKRAPGREQNCPQPEL